MGAEQIGAGRELNFSLGTVLLGLGGCKESGMAGGPDNAKGECEERLCPPTQAQHPRVVSPERGLGRSGPA